MDTNTVEAVKIISDKMDKTISVISTKLGVATDHFYPILVRQQYLESLTFIIGTITGAIFLWIVAFIFYKIGNKYLTTSKDTSECYTIFSAFSMIVAVVATIIAFSVVIKNIPILMNPEYSALMDLLKALR